MPLGDYGPRTMKAETEVKKQVGPRYVGNLLDALAIVAIALASGTLTIMLRLDKQSVASTAAIEQHERAIMSIVDTVKHVGDAAAATATRLTVLETAVKHDAKMAKSLEHMCQRLAVVESRINNK